MIMGLNLPTEVPWERMCVSRDMLERDVCSEDHLPKWRSSVAVWKYIPDEEYQIYPGRRITYLKVTATITGYQPRDKEVEGRFRGSPVVRKDIDSILDTFLPCTGAILQVTIGPNDGSNIDVRDYPYFMDFQPKKRDLYEMATDTKERSSRSAEELKTGKSAGTTRSQEVLDVDQGGSSGGSGGVSFAGYGAGGSSNASAQGQWGSKHLAGDQLNVVRSIDEAKERRETQSHTTQISQMYNLLDSYHLGTNRAVFLLVSRPHVLEEPSGLVKGPRPIDGIQEFFLVVNQAADQEHLCVSARLDTAHLTTVPIMEYERKPGPPIGCSVSPPLPNREDPPAPEVTLAVLDADDKERVGTFYYACHQVTANASDNYTAEAGFLIEDWNELKGLGQEVNGSSFVEISPSFGTITVTCSAASQRCFFRRADVDYWYSYNAPSTAGVIQGSATREVEPLLRSITKSKHVADRKVLLLTTRGVCCCSDGTEMYPSGIIGIGALEGPYISRLPVDKTKSSVGKLMAKKHNETGRSGVTAHRSSGFDAVPLSGALRLTAQDQQWPEMTAREANELGSAIRDGMLRLHAAGNLKPVAYVDTDVFIQQAHQRLLQHREARMELGSAVKGVLNERWQRPLMAYLQREDREANVADLIETATDELAEATGTDVQMVRELKLRLLGFEPPAVANKTGV
ncbi:hypothetical protein KXS15_26645 [Sinorhizobium meliloti]|uniref:hypothetical protein n=1 Tax=Rhizobium meliloti TaxID=382 RepID=UPI003F142746